MSERDVQLAYLRSRLTRPLSRWLGTEEEPWAFSARPSHRRAARSRPPAVVRQAEDSSHEQRLDEPWLDDVVAHAEETVRRVERHGVPTGAVWVPSLLALGAADVASSTRGLSVSSKGVGLLGAVGGVGLLATSVKDFRDAETLEEQLDAASDFTWGGQGLLYLGSSRAAGAASVGLGFVGSVTQSWVGARRIWQGVHKRDGELTKLGALDLGGGLMWLTWDIVGVGTPLFVTGYVVLMLGREAYANRRTIERAGRSFSDRLQRAVGSMSIGNLREPRAASEAAANGRGADVGGRLVVPHPIGRSGR